MERCSVCEGPALHYAHGLCRYHYDLKRRYGPSMKPRFPMEDRTGARNPAWKGDGAKHAAVHAWLTRNYEKKNVCEECGKEGRTDWAFQRWPESLTRNRDDYRELCRRCHQAFDVSTGERNYNHLVHRHLKPAPNSE